MVRKKFVSPESIITKPEKLVNLRLKKILQIQTDASSPALFSARSLDFRRGKETGFYPNKSEYGDVCDMFFL